MNDVHAKLNPTRVAEVLRPGSLDETMRVVRAAARKGETLCVSGSRHAMGGQQFAEGRTLIDARGLNHVVDFDPERGQVEVGGGIEWPRLLAWLLRQGRGETWTIRQKQTGADRLSVGGAISCNAHSRCLTRGPMVEDVESLLLVDPRGEPVRCSRTENPELFALAVGGYGLFGIVHSAVLRLERRHKQVRIVEEVRADDLAARFAARIAEGYTLGDFQFDIDDASDEFLTRGVFSCYRPVPWDTPIPHDQKKVPRNAWAQLVLYAHTDKAKAYALYRDYYLSTTGQVYLSDTSQFGGYLKDYHEKLDRKLGASCPATEVITELFVPRERLAEFLHGAAAEMRRLKGNVIYGTVRLVCRDDTTFLRWARDDYACVIFNLHVEHSPEGIEAAKGQFRALIDLALSLDGNYYLTYHRWATKEQVVAGYPQFERFLEKKREFDPGETFQSDWYRHYRAMFTEPRP